MAEQLHIGILETGRLPESLRGRHGTYPAMFESWLSPLEARFSSHAVLDGALPASPHEADLWLITGSRHGVYEDLPWIAPLEGFIRQCRDTGAKMLGICFGHQIIARALGGDVAKSPKGWGLGIHEYATRNWPDELAPDPGILRVQAFHQDQVLAPPEGARCIAGSDFCEYAALWYPGFALSVQGHPEFTRAYAQDLLAERRGAVLPEPLVDEALARMPERKTTSADFAIWLRDHLDRI